MDRQTRRKTAEQAVALLKEAEGAIERATAAYIEAFPYHSHPASGGRRLKTTDFLLGQDARTTTVRARLAIQRKIERHLAEKS